MEEKKMESFEKTLGNASKPDVYLHNLFTCDTIRFLSGFSFFFNTNWANMTMQKAEE